MFDKDNWQEIYQTLASNKMRTFLTAMGVFWGIFMLVIMLGAGKGLKNGTVGGFSSFATNSVNFGSSQTSIPYKGFPRGRMFYFTLADINAIYKNFPEVDAISPVCYSTAPEKIEYLNKSVTHNIEGHSPEFAYITSLKILNGRFINNIDMQGNRKVAVVGKRIADELFSENTNPINEFIKIGSSFYKVIGIYKSASKGRQAEWEDNLIYTPITTLQNTYNYKSDVASFWVVANNKTPIGLIEEKIVTFLKQRRGIHPNDNEAIWHWNMGNEFKKMMGLFLAINILIWIVGLGTLISGIVGVSNIMLIVIAERTKEIGIKRALGATPNNIIRQIVSESVVLTFVAGYMGLVLGVAILEGISAALAKSGADTGFFANPEVNFTTAIAALLILIISGILAGLLPAKRAVKIKPVDAIRNE